MMGLVLSLFPGIAVLDNPTVSAMSAALSVIWPDAQGQHYLDDPGLRTAVYRARGFSDAEIRAYDAAALEVEWKRREQAQCA